MKAFIKDMFQIKKIIKKGITKYDWRAVPATEEEREIKALMETETDMTAALEKQAELLGSMVIIIHLPLLILSALTIRIGIPILGGCPTWAAERVIFPQQFAVIAKYINSEMFFFGILFMGTAWYIINFIYAVMVYTSYEWESVRLSDTLAFAENLNFICKRACIHIFMTLIMFNAYFQCMREIGLPAYEIFGSPICEILDPLVLIFHTVYVLLEIIHMFFITLNPIKGFCVSNAHPRHFLLWVASTGILQGEFLMSVGVGRSRCSVSLLYFLYSRLLG